MNMRTVYLAFVPAIALSLSSGASQAALHNRGSGLIYDDVLDLTWLQDANHAKTSGYHADGLMSWADSLAWADQLVYAGYDDWRLPDVAPANGSTYDYAGSTDGHTDAGWNITRASSELAYMFYVNLGNEGARTPTGELTGCGASNLCFTQTDPFINIVPGYGAWYGEAFWGYGYPGYAWAFDSGGYQSGALQPTLYYAWAVRPGDVAPAVPEPGTLALLLAGLLSIGAVTRRHQGR